MYRNVKKTEMGLFDLFKPKKTQLQHHFDEVHRDVFPKGDIDINASVKELLHILNNKIDNKTARDIILKSVLVSRMSETFDRARLVNHLERYCIHYFSPEQVTMFHEYLATINIAKMVHGKTPSEVRRVGDMHIW